MFVLSFDRRIAAFGVLAGLVYAAAVLVIVPALPEAPDPGLLARALAVDLVVLVPAAWWLLAVRPGRMPGWSLMPMLALSLGGAWLVFPDAHHDALAFAHWLLPLAEGLVLLVLLARSGPAVRAYRRASDLDVLNRLRVASAAALGPGLAAEALAYEAALLRYALLGARAPEGRATFSSRRASGYGPVLATILLAALVELVGVHFLIRSWGEGWALAHAFLSAYTVLWLAGDFRALGSRPHRLTPGGLLIRCGLRWSADVPLGQIREVYAVPTAPPRAPGYLAAVPLDRVTHVVETAEPVALRGPYGLRREATRIGFCVDEPERFAERLHALYHASAQNGSTAPMR